MSDLYELLPALLEGLRLTLQITVVAAALGLACAVGAGLAREFAPRPFNWLAATYVEVFRGTSALVQLFWFFFALPLMGINLGAFLTAVLVLGLNTGAYGAEVVRGAIGAVPRGQWEAAASLGYGRAGTLRRVIFPQAALAMVPPTGNLLIELLKNTALVSMITLSDLTFRAQMLRAETLRTVEIFLLVLLLYYLAARLITHGMGRLERHLARGRDHGGRLS